MVRKRASRRIISEMGYKLDAEEREQRHRVVLMLSERSFGYKRLLVVALAAIVTAFATIGGELFGIEALFLSIALILLFLFLDYMANHYAIAHRNWISDNRDKWRLGSTAENRALQKQKLGHYFFYVVLLFAVVIIYLILRGDVYEDICFVYNARWEGHKKIS